MNVPIFTRKEQPMTTDTDQPAEPTNPLLPPGFDQEDGDTYVEPRLRSHWGLDQEEEYRRLGDTKQMLGWVRRTAIESENERQIAAGTLAPGVETLIGKEARLERTTGWQAPTRTGPEHRPAYLHAVRTDLARARADQADRRREMDETRARAEWCAIGQHRDPTTAYQQVHGIQVRACPMHTRRAEARIDELLAGESVDAWLDAIDLTAVGEPDEKTRVTQMLQVGRALAEGRVTGP